MRIAVCDDEKPFRNLLKYKLENYARKKAMIFLYDDFKDGVSLLKSTRNYDLIFLDYQMDSVNGMETARELRSRNNKTVIIFVTAFSNVVFESFEVDTFRFLTKPIAENKLYKALDDYFKSFSEDEYLILTSPNIKRINLNDILYVEAQNTACVIHTVNNAIKYARLLAEMESKLPKDRFYRCQKSFIVGFKHVVARSGKEITLDNGETIYISVRKVTEFKNLYMDYMKRYVFDGGEMGFG